MRRPVKKRLKKGVFDHIACCHCKQTGCRHGILFVEILVVNLRVKVALFNFDETERQNLWFVLRRSILPDRRK